MKPSPVRKIKSHCQGCQSFQVERMSFCKCCGEYFKDCNSIWFNTDSREFFAGYGEW